MPHYSPPLPFRRGRAGCPYVLACPGGRPTRGLRTCTLAGVPRPAPRIAAAYVRTGWRARVHAWRGGRGRARWLACPCPRPGSQPRMCALAGGRAPSATIADGRGTLEDGRGGRIRPRCRRARTRFLVRPLAPTWPNSGLARNYGAAIREKSVQW